jgi:hypothetical protein
MYFATLVSNTAMLFTVTQRCSAVILSCTTAELYQLTQAVDVVAAPQAAPRDVFSTVVYHCCSL